MASRAPQVSDLSAVKLARLDAEIASLQSKLAAKEQDRAELARNWGYANGYMLAVTPEQMRRSLAAMVQREGDEG